MPEVRTQAVTGLVPPQQDEARIREKWPSIIARIPPLATAARLLTRTTILAPLAWILMAPFFALKFMPFVMRRYTLTNRRVMVRAGWSGRPVQDVALADIDEVRVIMDANSDFYRTGTVDIVSKGQVLLSLPGTGEPVGFRHAIINARNAWVPGRASEWAFISASAPK